MTGTRQRARAAPMVRLGHPGIAAAMWRAQNSSMRLKGLLGLLALGAIAAAVLEWNQAGDGGAAPAQVRGVAQLAEPRDAEPRLAQRLKRVRMSGEVTGEPFGAREATRAATARAAAPPLAAVATPFLYRYAGQLSVDGGERRVYLTKGSELILVKLGDVLDGEFRVTAVGADALEVRHVGSNAATFVQYMRLNAEIARSAMPALAGIK